MKKISTKIVFLSLINTLLIAAVNVTSSLYMNQQNENSSAFPADATSVSEMPPMDNGMFAFMPTPILIGLIVSLVAGVILSYILGKVIARPILKMARVAEKTSQFDLREDKQFKSEAQKYKGEVGEMAAALGHTRAALREMAVRLQGYSSTLTAQSNQLSHNTEENVRAITQVVSTIDGIAAGNTEQADTIRGINDTLKKVVELIDMITREAASGADQAAASLEAVTEGQKTVELQSEKMNQNMKAASEAHQSIQELNALIEQVKGIADVMASIAGQTNLLALNATIEASRAGEAGRSFAVVASQIRNLADDSAKSAKEIADLIAKTAEKSKLAVHNISRSGDLMKEQSQALQSTEAAFDTIQSAYTHIVDSFKHTAANIGTISRNSKSISQQLQNMTLAAEEFAASSEQISATGQQQLASTEMIYQSAEELDRLAEQLNMEINKFTVA